jgi:hypothetical protein
MDAVSQVLAARAHEPAGLQGTVGASVLAHLGLIAAIVLAPAAWFGAGEKQPEVVMTISLGGPVGPNDGGMTQIGGRPVQEIAAA